MSTDHSPPVTPHLVVTSLTPEHPDADACARELRQRWHRTALHKITRPPRGDRPDDPDDYLDPAVEDAGLCSASTR